MHAFAISFRVQFPLIGRDDSYIKMGFHINNLIHNTVRVNQLQTIYNYSTAPVHVDKPDSEKHVGTDCVSESDNSGLIPSQLWQ